MSNPKKDLTKQKNCATDSKEQLKNLDIAILKTHKGLGNMIKKRIRLGRSHDTSD